MEGDESFKGFAHADEAKSHVSNGAYFTVESINNLYNKPRGVTSHDSTGREQRFLVSRHVETVRSTTA